MNYASLLKEYKSLLTGYWITDLANTSAFLMSEYPRINWVGFYLLEGQKLFLGPFQGKPACTEIAVGRGVCGKSVQSQQVMVVDDVHTFPDHITCDVNSRSEMVIPLFKNQEMIGVLDIDSPEVARFDLESQNFFKAVTEALLERQNARPSGVHFS